MVIALNVPTQARRNDARQSWTALTAAIHPLPYTPDAVHPTTLERSCDGIPASADANAEVVPARGNSPGYARICLTDRFFARCADERVLVLLHELVHIRLYLGRLAANYAAIAELLHRRPAVALRAGFDEDRATLAADTLTLAQEIGVDRFILANYPAHIATYRRMRRGFYEVPEVNTVRAMPWPALFIYRAFNYLVKAGLGVSVVEDRADRDAIQRRYDALLAELRTEAGDNFGRFDDSLRNLLSIRIDTDDRDPDAYREIFDRINAVPEAELPEAADRN